MTTIEQLSAAATQGEWVVEIDTRTEVCRVTQDELSYTAGYNISADSEVIGCEGIIPGPNAEYDAAFICQLVNLYRTGQLVEVQPDDATVERVDATNPAPYRCKHSCERDALKDVNHAQAAEIERLKSRLAHVERMYVEAALSKGPKL